MEYAETQDRTVDTAIFSRVLYQLSYLGERFSYRAQDFNRLLGECQANAKIR